MGKNEIVRRPDRATGGITNAERERMRELSELWVNRAFRTESINRQAITSAIHGLYEAAGVKRPRVVIVSSPRIMAFAGGFAAAIWWLRRNSDNCFFAGARAATDDATYAATYAATDDATDAATYAATDDATRAATYAATYDATRAATYDATRAATYDATYDAGQATRGATKDAAPLVAELTKFFLDCAARWWNMYHGGNMWSAWCTYLAAYRDVLGLRLPQHEKYRWWEEAAIHGGFRIMHEEFCMVSDFPEVLKVDEENRPHCEDGPSHRWRDGWSLYFWHGVRVTEQIILRPETLTIEQIRGEENAEVRRVMLERFGWDRFAEEGDFEIIHRDEVEFQFPAIPVSEVVSPEARLITTYRQGKEVAELIQSKAVARGDGLPMTFVRLTDPSTGRRYHLRVDPNCKRAYEAVGKSGGMTEAQYKQSMYHRQGDVFLLPLDDSGGASLHS